MKREGSSIRLQYSLAIVGTVAVIILALCLLMATQLGDYSVRCKQQNIKEVIQVIKDSVDSDFDEEDQTNIEQVSKKSNLDVTVVVNKEGTAWVAYSSDFRQAGSVELLMNYFRGTLEIDDDEIYEENDEYVIYKSLNNRMNNDQIICIGSVGEDVLYVMSTPIEGIKESAALAIQFLIILGIFAMFLGGLMGFLISRSLARPITQLSEISQRVAELDFDARYEGRQKNEIGMLGKNINHMSDNLQKAIGELREANAQLERDLKEKEKIDEMRRLFLSNASHELKTPIALIQGYAEGLQEGIADDPESMNFYCDVIVDEAGKMNNIVKRLLNLDAIESGQMELSRENYDLSELLKDGAQSARMLAVGKEVEWKLEIPDGVYVNADPFLTESMIQNYLSNACHYVSDPGTIHVALIPQDDHVIVSVHNTGQPIPLEDIEHIWDKFYKVDKARTRAYGGSGIGLSIVKAIINAHGTRCGAINRDGGVEFWFELPLAEKD